VEKAATRGQTIVGPLQIWDKLELVFEESGRQGRYRTRIEDAEGDMMLIDRPSLLTGDALFRVGANFVAWFIKSDSAYTFSGKILRKADGELDTYYIGTPRSVDRNQRRRFFRISDDSPVIIIPIDALAKEQDPPTETKVFEGVAMNLSGNGMQVRSKLEAPIGAKVILQPRIKEIKREFNLFGIIRRKETDADGLNIYGIEFFTIEEVRQLFSSFPLQRLPQHYLTFNENLRTLLLNYIFARQLELKKKGLI
jgi:c-di-GMP-binding flagellar brake protein YcgR